MGEQMERQDWQSLKDCQSLNFVHRASGAMPWLQGTKVGVKLAVRIRTAGAVPTAFPRWRVGTRKMGEQMERQDWQSLKDCQSLNFL
jgi:hypothetical protein